MENTVNSRRTIKHSLSLRVPLSKLGLFLLLIVMMLPSYGKGVHPYILVTGIAVPYCLSGYRRVLSRQIEWTFIYYAFTYITARIIHFYSGSIPIIVTFVSYYVLCPIIILSSIRTRDDFDDAITMVIIIFTLYSILGIYECISGINIFDIVFARKEVWSAAGVKRYGFYLSYGALTIMHNNAILVCMGWAMAAYRLCNEKSRTIWTICWAIIGVYCLIMMSRMVIFTSIILQIIIFIRADFKRLVITILLAILVIMINPEIFKPLINISMGLFSPIVDEIFGTSFSTNYASNLGGSGQRLILWSWIIDSLHDNILFGKGYGGTWSTTLVGTNQYGQIWYANKTSIEVHWLITLYQSGLYGLSGFIAFQIGSLSKAWFEEVSSVDETVTFQYVFKMLTITYFLQLFGVAAAEEIRYYYLILALYSSYILVCDRSYNESLYTPNS